MRRDESCSVCGRPVDTGERFVLVRGRRSDAHCSESCLEDNIRLRWIAGARRRRRWLVALALPALVAGGAVASWRRFHAPARHAISQAWPEVVAKDAPPEPIVFGPPWPPTDEQWIAVLNGANGIFPLPGPDRRALHADDRILVPDAPKSPPARCREKGLCGLDLGGDLWGEHVYAAFDGVVERVHLDGNDRRGGIYVRLAHFGGGMVFTQYFHLAGTPRGIRRGVHVKAGDILGLLGDTGLDGARRHLHFALSIRPSPALSEIYWDPTPWMTKWPLRVPSNGTVAGLTHPQK